MNGVDNKGLQGLVEYRIEEKAWNENPSLQTR
ncbi:hypothetical protein FHS27_002884 [Rhodopirellula rubra]|uniref:Uncharacterized protein n=1 Tax=Aporhodopirellula rubra TaxID=980271 RepID=A0A7W5DZ21_9BACT|nr:hypothetical protein [Aporhodopirellula rubra]